MSDTLVTAAVPAAMTPEQVWDAWRAAREQARAAYAAWCTAERAHRKLAFAAFVAATDQEAAAEHAFARHRSGACP